MADWNLGVGTLIETNLNGLAVLLDNAKCGWKQLAKAAMDQPRFRCSESELTNCSLQVLNCSGSSGRFLLDMLKERGCTLAFLLQCLRKMEHHEAIEYLTTAVEQIQITVQPQPQHALEGSRVVLSCKGSGPPTLGYQWFKGKEEIPGGSGPNLVVPFLTAVEQGHYICRVNHGERFIFSNWAHVRVIRSGNSSSEASSTFFPTTSGLRIIYQPRQQTLSEGEDLLLRCSAEANPPPQYQWYHNKKPLETAVNSKLKIPGVTTADRGSYYCRVFNLYHEIRSEEVHINIGPSSMTEVWKSDDEDLSTGSTRPPSSFYDLSMGSTRPPSSFYATDKVALLMGNMNYLHHRQLRAPMADVHELTNLLRQLDFKVVSLLDLNWQEMHSAVTEFLLLLHRGVYGLLYFAGHGYENYGNSFMVPIDAPASYTSEHCLWVQGVLHRMQERETGLNVFLLDMCRKRNLNDVTIPRPDARKVTANIVFGYATCVDAEAYEVNKDDLSNGIFISYLKKRLMEDEKVTVMLDRVAEDMGRCRITRGRQALELRSNLSERRALTDKIQSTDCSVTSARNLQWAIAHVLPESRTLEFDCGVKVQLGYAAEFSNIMIIYTRILQQPKDIDHCSAQLSNFSEDLEIDLKHTNQESLEEAGSILFTIDFLPQPEVPKLYTRLKALQRLKKELTFTVCLHYQYSNLEEEVQERQTVSIGKPLVSKLNLHEPTCSSSSSFDFNSSSLPESAMYTQGLGEPSETSTASTSAATSWSYYSTPGETPEVPPSNKVNLPEENLDTDECQPYSATKSLPYAPVDDITFRFSNMQNFHSL
ncbi:MALT paracaspase 2 [Clupea harengus]|uniref:MALT paracaspase 2 n=1 Tax=Clupea harengus TaxID=7950 RepID=A0A6P8FWC7_CLUHA|nr:MALT paracaspase 2 [Clupea harengus]